MFHINNKDIIYNGKFCPTRAKSIIFVVSDKQQLCSECSIGKLFIKSIDCTKQCEQRAESEARKKLLTKFSLETYNKYKGL